jgi:hypothetical protein
MTKVGEIFVVDDIKYKVAKKRPNGWAIKNVTVGKTIVWQGDIDSFIDSLHTVDTLKLDSPVSKSTSPHVSPVSSPKVQSPVSSPKVQSPVSSPKVQSPVSSPKVQSPVAQPKVQSPVAQPKVQSPVAQPKVLPQIGMTRAARRAARS